MLSGFDTADRPRGGATIYSRFPRHGCVRNSLLLHDIRYCLDGARTLIPKSDHVGG